MTALSLCSGSGSGTKKTLVRVLKRSRFVLKYQVLVRNIQLCFQQEIIPKFRLKRLVLSTQTRLGIVQMSRSNIQNKWFAEH